MPESEIGKIEASLVETRENTLAKPDGIVSSNLFTYARNLKEVATRTIGALQQNKQKEFWAFAVLFLGAIELGAYRGHIFFPGVNAMSLMPLLYSVQRRTERTNFSDSTDRVKKNPRASRLLTAAEWAVGLSALGLIDYAATVRSGDMFQLGAFVVGGNAAQVLFRENLEVLLSKIPKLRQDKLQ